MESAVKVALPAAVAEARLSGSAEGLGGGGGDVVVRELRVYKEDLCILGIKKDDVHAVNASEPPAWHKIPNPEPYAEVYQPSSSLHSNDASNGRGFQNMNFHPSNPDSKPLLEKSCKKIRSNSGYNKKSGVVQMEICRSKPAHDVNGIYPELAASAAVCSLSEKNPMLKQKSSTGRRGDKRNSKVKQKNKSDTLSLKNGLVAFNSAAGGSNFFGMYGLKHDVIDITKYVSEKPLDELLRGNYSCPSIGKDKGKKASDSNNNLLLSITKACSVLQPQKALADQNCSETDNGGNQNFSTGLVSGSSEEGQVEGDKGDCYIADLPSSDKVQESDYKIKKFNLADCLLYQPKDVLDRLALSPSKDLDLLLSDNTVKTTAPKNNTDARSGKPSSNRTGLPPFPWSNSFSAHSKLGSDATKSSSSRTICQGGWVKVNISPALSKGSLDLLKDFESLSFNQSLVPSISLTSEHLENEIAPIERVFSTTSACSTSRAPADDYPQACAAAQTLLDLASYSKGSNSRSSVKSLKRPSGMAMKSTKSKGIEWPKPFFNPPKPLIRPSFPSKSYNDGFPSKKLRPSTDTPNRSNHTEHSRKGTLHWPVKPPPGKLLFRDSNPNPGTDAFNPNFVKKSISMKPPRGAERPPGHGNLQKFRKLS